MKIGLKQVVGVVFTLALLMSVVGCAAFAPVAPRQTETKIIEADCIFVESSDGKRMYRTTDETQISEVISQASTGMMLKENDSTKVWLLKDNELVESMYVYEQAQYEEWDEDVPAELLDTIDAIMTKENQVNWYQFEVEDPTQHEQLVQSIRLQEAVQCYIPKTEEELVMLYPSIFLYYTCFCDRSDDYSETDRIFDGAISWLDQSNMIHQCSEPTISSVDVDGSHTRKVEVILNFPADDVVVEKVRSILEYDTSEYPFKRADGTPGGVVNYYEPEPYTIYVIAEEPLSDDVIARLEQTYDIERAGEAKT